jgi:DNA-binding winged helix-turn-helix (wHTH) protein
MAWITIGSYVLDPATRSLMRNGAAVHVEPKVMDLLLYLVEHRERCVSRVELRAKLWPDVVVGEASLTRLVKQLRKSLAEDGDSTPPLRTVYGHGYQFLGRGSTREAGVPSLAAGPVERTERSRLYIGPLLSKALAPLKDAAAFGVPVIVEGETGTGKECVARALHDWSGRSGELVPLRCQVSTDAELEASLSKARESNGTLLVDEIGELPRSLQARLTAALSDEELSNRSCLARRTVVLSRRSTLRMVAQGELRSDLLARLCGIKIELPPLRERRKDLTGLVEFLLERFGGGSSTTLPQSVIDALCAHDWPFNVRELEMFVLRWLALSDADSRAELAMLLPTPRQQRVRRQPARLNEQRLRSRAPALVAPAGGSARRG